MEEINYCSEIEDISFVLNTPAEKVEGGYVWTIISGMSPKIMVYLYIYLDNTSNFSVSVQTAFGIYELHNVKICKRFLEEEVVFISLCQDNLSALVISRNYGVNLYSNLPLSAVCEYDPTTTDDAFIFSASQLSMYKDVILENI